MIFKCQHCTDCCKDFSNKEKNIDGLPLFEWEVEKMQNIAKERGTKLIIKPIILVGDKKSGKYICPTFKIPKGPCPFLKENKCSIYEQRPLICKSYPIMGLPIDPEKKGENMNINICPQFKSREDFFKNFKHFEEDGRIRKRKDLFEDCLNIFGEEIVLNATLMEFCTMSLGKIMEHLVEEKIVKLKKVGSIDRELKTPTPLLEFAEQKGLLDKENFIKELIDYGQAQKLLNNIIEK